MRILFSGDVGRYDGPLYHDPSPPTECDYLICESTYGNRDHPETDLLASLRRSRPPFDGAWRRHANGVVCHWACPTIDLSTCSVSKVRAESLTCRSILIAP